MLLAYSRLRTPLATCSTTAPVTMDVAPKVRLPAADPAESGVQSQQQKDGSDRQKYTQTAVTWC
jgi:hypothetical protein